MSEELSPLLNDPIFTLLSSIQTLKITAALAGIFNVAIVILAAPIASDLITIHFISFFSPDAFRRIVSRWTPYHVYRFKLHFIPDFIIFPILFSTLLMCVFSYLTLTCKWKIDKYAYYLILLGISAIGFFDVVENIIHLSIADNLLNADDFRIRASGLAALIKWILTMVYAIGVGITYLNQKKHISSTKKNE